jgi:hypothetical protein
MTSTPIQPATPQADPLAGLPDDLRVTLAAFWADLRPSGLQAACPDCGAVTLARYARGQQRRWWYVVHCGDVRQVTMIW